jgi:very-short-patch-repair endonuclease
MTPAEEKLWTKIRIRQLKGFCFYRQKPIGPYIVDFYCPKAKLVIEVDGQEHISRMNAEYDEIRDKFMNGLNLQVLRFSNTDVLTNIVGILEIVVKSLPDQISPYPSLRKRGRPA